MGHLTLAMVAFVALLAGCSDRSVGEQQAQHAANREASRHDPDDTGRNARDREGNTLTPFDQGSAPADVAITRQIRRAIASDDTMSVAARNAKVITNDGVVTLRGPVEDAEEKTVIEAKAKAVVGVTRVDNQLEVPAK